MNLQRKNSITILGCGGFIGSHILGRILDTTEYMVCGADTHDHRIQRHIGNSRFEFHKVNIYTDIQFLEAIISKSATVISLAALCNPSLYTTVPVNVIESNFVNPYQIIGLCAAHNSRLLHFSTCEVYGKTIAAVEGVTLTDEITGGIPLNEIQTPMIMGSVQAQRWCYAAAKQLLERAIYAWGFQRGLHYTIIRPFNFIGPGMDFIPGVDGDGIPRVLACFMEALLSGKPIRLVDGGKNRRCFTYIDDAVDAVMLMLQYPADSNRKIFNIGNPSNEITMEHLAQLMIRIYKELKPEMSCRLFDVKTVSSEEFYGPGYEDSDRRIPDIASAGTHLGWRPKTSLDDALKMSMNAFIDTYSIH